MIGTANNNYIQNTVMDAGELITAVVYGGSEHQSRMTNTHQEEKVVKKPT
jgi:hypothetical protein